MSRNIRRKGGRTARIRKTKDTIDEDDGGGVEATEKKVDPIMGPAERAVRKLITWIKATQSTPGGLFEWFTKNVEKPSGDNSQANSAYRIKNRNPDVPCVEETRVKLKEITDPTKDYIHANYIRTPPSERVYIATQHPLESTYEDFWRMVFYENVDTIVAIFSADENLPLYFPNEVGKFNNHGAFFVNCRKVVAPTAKHTPFQYQIEVLPEGCSNSRIILILHYPYWPKNQVPANTRVVMKTLRLIKVDKSSNGPVVVHCASGINRAGCLIFADIIIDLVFRNIEIDILQLIKKTRIQRAQLVQNKHLFVYSIYLFTDYVKIRCKRYKIFPDILKDIDAFQEAVNKEFSPLLAREPDSALTKRGGTTVEE
ncbi:unnamed protein product [Caenorhabditis bovis]|uniref:Protein-tyrosine-phosphatase n=1 Tax=Caenorhabditis bovis TaxID=2654633 RepID=A0A8S1EJZ2_9PELO|nr:unnamed protein product [Caenorhabditis bovis]